MKKNPKLYLAFAGALDIFRGIIVRGNINLYTAIIALAFSNGKEKRKSWSCLCSPRSNGSKAMGVSMKRSGEKRAS